MRSKIAAFAGGVLLMLTAGGAQADGMPYRSYPKDVPVVADCCQAQWSGLFVAASIGMGFAETDFDHAFSDSTTSGRNAFDLGSSDITGTIAIGYDRDIGNGIVLGVFGDYTFGSLEADFTLRTPDRAPQNLSVEYDDSWAVGARIGLARSCCTLWYFTAGYTSTHVDFEQFDSDLDGYFLGGGVEQQFGEGWSLKLEYRFSDYNEDRLFSYTSACGGCRETIDVDTEIHAVRLGISYKFGLHREAVYAPAPLK